MSEVLVIVVVVLCCVGLIAWARSIGRQTREHDLSGHRGELPEQLRSLLESTVGDDHTVYFGATDVRDALACESLIWQCEAMADGGMSFDSVLCSRQNGRVQIELESGGTVWRADLDVETSTAIKRLVRSLNEAAEAQGMSARFHKASHWQWYGTACIYLAEPEQYARIKTARAARYRR